MNERIKEARKELGLTQVEFARRIGVTNPAISKIEKGQNSLTEQMIIAVCREFSISESWLRTGIGSMKITSENALIAQLSDQYNLDALDRKMLEIYVGLPEAHKQAFKSFALKLAGAAVETGLNTEFANELTYMEEMDDNYRRMEFGRNLTEDEAVALVRQRYSDAKKDTSSSTTLKKVDVG